VGRPADLEARRARPARAGGAIRHVHSFGEGMYGGEYYDSLGLEWIKSIEFVAGLKHIGKGHGGKNEDDEYFDLIANI
jgi:hypothetical protein